MAGRLLIVALLLVSSTSISLAAEQYPVDPAQAKAEAIDYIVKLIRDGNDINARDEEGFAALHIAVKANQANLVDILVSREANIELAEAEGNTPLHLAAMSDYKDIAELLLKAGASIDSRNEKGRTPLYMALVGGNKEAASLLIDHGADVNAADKLDWMPIHPAAGYCDAEIMGKLIEKGADAGAVNSGGNSALHMSAYTGNAQTTLFLLEKGVETNVVNAGGETPLCMWITKKNEKIIEKLLAAGADPTLFSYKFESSLLNAVDSRRHDLVEMFIKYKADLNAFGRSGETAFFKAVEKGDLKMMELLAKAGSNINIPNASWYTPLTQARFDKKEGVVEWLKSHGAVEKLQMFKTEKIETNPFIRCIMGRNNKKEMLAFFEAGADVEARCSTGGTALHWLVRSSSDSKSSMAKMAIEQGADVNARDVFGRTPLYDAAAGDKIELIELLLENGAELDAKTILGTTPVYVSVKNHSGFLSKNSYKYLIGKGADMNVCDPEGNTLLHEACDNGDPEMIKLLLDNNANPYCPNNRGEPPVFSAIRNEKVVEAFLDKGMDVNVRDMTGATLLHRTAMYNYTYVIKMLLERGADIDARNDGNWTALHMAARYGSDDAVSMLLDYGIDPTVKEWRGKTALEIAVERNKTSTAKLLRGRLEKKPAKAIVAVEKKTSPSVPEKTELSRSDRQAYILTNGSEWGRVDCPAFYAVLEDDVEKLKTIIAAGADPNELHKTNYGNFSMLHWACYFDREKTVKYLLGLGVDPDIRKAQNGISPLQSAARAGCIEIGQILIEAGSEINVRGGNIGDTALHYAAEKGWDVMVKMLLENGAERNIVNDMIYTALDTAIWACQESVVKAFIEAGTDINTRGDKGKAAVHRFAGNTAHLTFLAKMGADFNARDGVQKTPIHYAAASQGDTKTIKILLDNGVDINAGDKLGFTALHYAASNENYRKVEYLLSRGAEANVVNERNQTPLHLGTEDIRIVKILLEHGVDATVADYQGQTALHHVSTMFKKGDAAEVTPFLIEAGLDINAGSILGSTPLHLAAQIGNEDVARIMIENGADVNLPNKRGETPYQVAVRCKHSRICKILKEAGAVVPAAVSK